VNSKSFRPPITLTGTYLELAPTQRSHAVALHEAASDPEISRYLIDGPGTTLEEVEALIELVLGDQQRGEALAFTALRLPDRRPVGMTRFLNIDRRNESVDVGGTWFSSDLWRTPLNTESKFLMFRHAFEVEGAHRIRLNTDLRNERSQAAIARLGATREGVLREDRLLRSGYRRSSVAFSVLADEWPRVRTRLERFLAKPWTSGADRST
jgi:N-acetyltransferase